MADKKYLSVFIDTLLPDYVRTEYSQFTEFIKTYLEFLEADGNPYNVIQEFLRFIDIDQLDNTKDSEIIKQYVKQYISAFPLYKINNIDIKTLIKNAKDFYSIKGTEKSYKFLFRLMEESNISFHYPSNEIFIISNKDSKISGRHKIHDNEYYAYFTYELKGAETNFAELKEIILNLLHPVGTKLYYMLHIYPSYTDTEEGSGTVVLIFFLISSGEETEERYDNVFNDTFDEMNTHGSYLYNMTWGDLRGWGITLATLNTMSTNTTNFNIRKNVIMELVT